MNCKRVVVVAVVAALALGACSSDKKTGSPSSNGGPGAVTVYTSGVYQELLDRLVKAYTATHKTAKITVVTKASPKVLKSTIDAGRPSLIVLVNQQFRPLGTKRKPVQFGRDRAVIAVSTKNPHKVTSITAFASTSGLKVGTCGVRTVFGNTTQWALHVAKVKWNPSIIGAECNAKALRQVANDELDAVLVFRGGAFPPKGVKLLEVPADQNIVVNLSYLAVGKSAAVAQFGTFLTGAGARRILTNNGYLP